MRSNRVSEAGKSCGHKSVYERVIYNRNMKIRNAYPIKMAVHLDVAATHMYNHACMSLIHHCLLSDLGESCEKGNSSKLYQVHSELFLWQYIRDSKRQAYAEN